jgi:site-specific DNA-cytosine methylase
MVQVGTADLNGHDILKRVYGRNGKSPTVSAHAGGNQEPKVDVDGITWRKLTPLECERLQTLPDNYTAGISNTQRYKVCGNSWTTEMIVEILKQM